MACLSPSEGNEEGLTGYTVRFEARGKEFSSVARLIQAVGAKAKLPQPARARGVGMKVPKSQGGYPNPHDLALARVKSLERGVEAR